MILPVDPSRYLAYLGVMTAMCFFPGPANLFSVAAGVSRGWKGVLAGVAGMNSANLVWYAGAAVGLSALMAAFPGVFRLMSLAGALYLLWLAYGAVRKGRDASAGTPLATGPRGRSTFVDGFAVQMGNPKAVLFFSAVLPSFVDLHRPMVPQLVLYAPPSILMDATAMTIYGLGGAAFARRMEAPAFRRGFAFVTAALLAAAALLVALSALNG